MNTGDDSGSDLPKAAPLVWAPRAELAALRGRAEALASVRSFFAERDVLEVSTPVLGRYTVTDPQVEAIEVPGYGFLQTSPEAGLKRLLAAGIPSLYQLGPAFRADERGRLHSPEFTLLEWYRLGFDSAALRDEVAALVDRLLGPAPYAVMPVDELLDRGRSALRSQQLSPAAAADEDLVLLTGIESLTEARVFVVDFPAEQAAMARLKADDPRYADRFELIINGVEIANGYAEAVNADELRQRFAEDRRARAALGRPDREPDPYLLAAMDAGLPDCAGVALGVDRLLMLALDLQRIDGIQALSLDPR
ncbi:MAG: amino acid--tRNA ligase-related protein [Pseudomonadota bacterium]